MEDDWLDALAGGRGVGPAGPAEVTEGGQGFPGEVVGGEPVVVHDGECQTRKPVSVLLGTHLAGGGVGVGVGTGTGLQITKEEEIGGKKTLTSALGVFFLSIGCQNVPLVSGRLPLCSTLQLKPYPRDPAQDFGSFLP